MDVGAERVGWRPAFSILTGVGWLSFIIIWLFFYAGNYNIYQNIAVFIISLIVLAFLNGLVWAIWGLRYAPKGWLRMAGWRGMVSMVTLLAWLIFLIAWLLIYAADFNVYQNIAVIFVSILIVGGINAAIWSTWKEKPW